MNFKAIVSTVFTTAFLASAPGALAYGVQRGNIAGYQGVTAIDRGTVDTLTIPFPNHEGIVEVNCRTGQYSWNGITQAGALAIVRQWCS